MTEYQAMQLLKMPTSREAAAKAILMLANIAMGGAIVFLWFSGISLNLSKKAALSQAATIQPVRLTQEEAQAILAQRAAARAKAAAPAAPGTPGILGAMAPGGARAMNAGQPPVEMASYTGRGGMRRGGLPGNANLGGPPQGGPFQGGPQFGPQGGPQPPSALTAEMAALMESRPLFGAPPKSGPPQANLQGILGDQALINGNWVKVGENQGGIKLVRIMADKVVVAIEGQEREVSVWQDLPTSPQPPSGSMGSPSGMARGMSPQDMARMQRSAMQSGSGNVSPAMRGSAAIRRTSTGAANYSSSDYQNAQQRNALERQGGMAVNTPRPISNDSSPAMPLETDQTLQPRRAGRGMAGGANGSPDGSLGGGVMTQGSVARNTPRPQSGSAPARAGRRTGGTASDRLNENY